MRNEFIAKLVELAEKDERIVFLTADLGFSVVEEFAKKFPKRFYNMGVSEQNMIGVATGLAESGFIPFTYSIGPFSVLRPYEFIKNGPILHNLPVKIVAVGPGYEYGNLGASHHLLEDIAAMRLFPNLFIHVPINGKNAQSILENTYTDNSPGYYRVGKDKKSLSDTLDLDYYRNVVQLSKGQDSVCIIGLGSIIEEIIPAVNHLKTFDRNVSSYAITRIDNNLAEDLLEIIKKYKTIISVEANYVNGGIGSIIAEVIAENGLKTRLKRLGVKQLSDGVFGSTKFMYKKNGISDNDIIKEYER